MSENEKSLTSNELMAKSLCIGRELSRSEWWKMNAEQAMKFCVDKAESMGVLNLGQRRLVALYAMNYVIQGR